MNTVPGGRYLTSDGVLRDANGKPIIEEAATLLVAAEPEPVKTEPVEPVLEMAEPEPVKAHHKSKLQ